ncbi:phosphate signaling complex protein PhoU [Facklamia miroungae]|uniref:Phosphate-specific transport system accessory protein PhoU n=1 Tax=Facklamia miroungae TaxID=120956 RepID=A0A1G7S0V8_9LACT|nr:phosphate signaling complex protein PhoU [Facklamia miroungae]NKZ29206.1 phosphate signaling complex protein PhoU [Facklamia miroungae]SDG16655.1 phosphate transport system protein [Facklamia miroungae]
MRKLYTQDLQNLLDKAKEMFNLTQKIFASTIECVNASDTDIAKTILKMNEKIDQLSVELEKDAYVIVALQQPVAADLRFIFALLNTSVELKRIAEHTTTIAKRVKRNKPDFSNYQDMVLIVNQMAERLQLMFEPLASIIENGDIQGASQIACMDSEIDNQYDLVFDEVTLRMSNNEDCIPAGIFIIDLVTSFERIGDYITNICEHVLYLETGSTVYLN